jgi:dTDP-4-dehydrorhamnose reductase
VRALLIGKTGQLARELLRAAPPEVELTALDRNALDLSDHAAVFRAVHDSRTDVVINAAAYTAVDLAESEQERAYAINDIAVGSMAQACRERRARLVHVSTDFVFDGAASRPYRVNDPTHPLNVYGASKLAGEQRIATTPNLEWCIVRTAWVYSATGKNFMLTMLKLMRERGRVQVVTDQIGTPTSAGSLADCVWRAARDDDARPNVLHFTDAGVASWYDFALAIYEEARALAIIRNDVQIVPINTTQYPTPARRPAYSVLDKGGTYARLGIEPVHWRVRLREVLRELSK